LENERYFVYKYDFLSKRWLILDNGFQAKKIRFDRLGNHYFLTPNNCVLDSQKVEILCGVSDFEVTIEKVIIGISDGSGRCPTDDVDGEPRLNATTGYS